MRGLFTAAFSLVGWQLGNRPINDNSFLWHLRTGQRILDHGVPHRDLFSFTAHGAPWVAQSWLAEALYAIVDRLMGPLGIRLLGTLTGALIGVMAYRLALRLARDRTRTALITVAALTTSLMVWSQRPLILGVIAMVALLWIVEVPDSWPGRRPLLSIPILMWLWINVHGSFALGFVYLGLHLAGRWLDGAPPWRDRELRLVQGAVAGLALCLLNPYGIALVAFPAHLMARGDILRWVVEWRSPDFRTAAGIAFAGWIAVFVGVLAFARTRPTRGDVLVSVSFLLLALWAQRNIALAPLVGIPVLARMLAPPAERPERPDHGRPLNWVVLALIGLVSAVYAVQAAGRPGLELDRQYPVKALQAVRNQHLLGHHLLTTDAWAGYVIYAYWPDQDVFIDDRYDMYPVRLMKEYDRLLRAEPDWRSILDRHGINVVVWDPKAPLSQLLAREPGWTRLYQDDRATVFARGR
jgi:hypothetical protein